jgi:hypothetical protein
MITIITSFFGADEYIDHYLKNVSKIIGYNKLCIHTAYNILGSHLDDNYVNNKLTEFSKNNNNFILFEIKKDPGLYSLWNTSIKYAKTPYMMTLNIDDTCEPNYIIKCLAILRKNHKIDLISCPIKITKKKNAKKDEYHKIWHDKKNIYYDTRHNKIKQLQTANVIKDSNNSYIELKCNRDYKKNCKKIPNKFKKYININYKQYCLEDMFVDWHCNGNYKSFNIPHCAPIWKRSLHDQYGYLNEKEYGVYADFEFWLRLLKNDLYFCQLNRPMILYLENDNSHNRRCDNKMEYMNKIKNEYF